MNIYFKYSLLIILVALAVRLPGLNYPKRITFDEVAGMTYSLHVLYNKPYFDVHPPLVELIYTGWMHITSKPDFQNKILFNDHNFGNYPYLLLRFITAVGGSLIPLLGGLVGWKLFRNQAAGLVIGLAMALDNALILYSRFLLPDIWLILFGLAAFALVLKKKNDVLDVAGLGILLGATVSVKWTGFGFWVLVLGYLLGEKKYKTTVLVGSIATAFYVIVWIIFFSVVGTGMAFSGIQPVSGKLSYPGKDLVRIIDYLPLQQLAMLNVNKLLLNHESASSPIQWIWGEKKITLFTDNNKTIVLRGNLIGWWSIPGAIGCAILMIKKSKNMRILLTGYLINLIPFFFLDRIFFIYHYLPALVIGYILLGGIIYRFEPKWMKVWIFIYIVGFVSLSPITYGWNFPGWWVRFLVN